MVRELSILLLVIAVTFLFLSGMPSQGPTGLQIAQELDRNLYLLLASQISFTDPTPANNTVTTNNSFQVNITMTNVSSLANFTWNWNGTNYTLYNDSLILMMNFDNRSLIGENSTKVVDLSLKINNATCTTNCPTWNSSGKYGGAYHYDESAQMWSINDIVDKYELVNNNYSIMVWLYDDTAGGANYACFFAEGSNRALCKTNADGYITYYYSGADHKTNIQLPENTWTHFAMVVSSTNVAFYINGTPAGTATEAPQLTLMYVGGDSAAGEYWGGFIDDLFVWNRSISAAEVQQYYNSNFYKYDTGNWTFWTNQSNLTTGTYTYSGSANDTSSNHNTTGTRTVSITNTPCGTITGNATLDVDLSATGTCMTIGANNIVLDCAGHTITWDTAGGGNDYAITASNKNNITVKNCVVTDGNSDGTGGRGIKFTAVSNSTIQNSTVNTNGTSNDYGIYLETNPENNLLINNTVRGQAAVSNTGIYVWGPGFGNNISNNTVLSNGTNNVYGIYADTLNNSVITGNTVQVSGPEDSNFGIYVYGPSFGSSISQNVVITNGSTVSHGIYADGVWNYTITKNAVKTSGTADNNYGIYLYGPGSGNNISQNNITTNGTGSNNHGIRLENGANNNTFHDNFITTLSGLSYGISLLDSSDNRFNGTTLNATREWVHSGVGMLNNFSNTTFQTGNGSINSTPLWTLTGLQNITQLLLNMTNNSAFVNTTNLTMLNTTAQIRLNGVTLTIPVVFSSIEDNGQYTLCSSLTCVNQSYSRGVFTFNVTHFTTYRASERSLTGSVSGFNTSIITQVDNTSNVTLAGTVNVSFLLRQGETVNLSNTEINTTTGLTVITNLTLPIGVTKSVQVSTSSGTSQLCIVDTADASVVQPDCANGVIINCPGTTGSYTCSTNGTIATITGLSHTAVGSFGSASRGGTGGAASSGGGGAGPSKEHAAQTVQMNSNIATYALQKGDTVVLFHQNQQHTISVLSLTPRTVTIRVASTPQEFTLRSGTPLNADLDGDGTNDIHIKLAGIDTTGAHITISKIVQTTQATQTRFIPNLGTETQEIVVESQMPITMTSVATKDSVRQSEQASYHAPARKTALLVFGGILVVVVLFGFVKLRWFLQPASRKPFGKPPRK